MDDPLVVSAWLGEDRTVRSLMKAKKNDAAILDSAVLAAGEAGHLRVVETLLKGKADVNSDAATRTLLNFVTQQDRLEVVPLFLQCGLGANSKTAGTIFEYAANKGKASGDKVVHMLLDNGFRPDSEAGGKGLQLAAQEGHEEIVKALFEAKADPGSHDGGLALRGAAIMGQVKVVHLLLKFGVMASSQEGNDALKCAVNIDSKTIVKLLLVANSDPSYALPMAAFRSNAKLAKLLLELKADAKSKRKAMKEAARYGHETILNLLVDEGTEIVSREGEAAWRMTDCALRMNCENTYMLEKKAGVLDILETRSSRRVLPRLADVPMPSSPCNKTQTPLVLSPKEKEAPRWHSAAGFGLRNNYNRMNSANSAPSLRY